MGNDWLGHPLALLWLAPVLVCLVATLFLARAKLSRSARAAVLASRFVAIAMIVVLLAVPQSRQSSAEDSRTLCVLVEGMENAAEAAAAPVGNAEILLVCINETLRHNGKLQADASVGDFLRRRLAGPDKPARIDATLQTKDLAAATAILETSGVPYTIAAAQAPVANHDQARPNHAPDVQVKAPWISLDAPPLVIPNEPFLVRATCHHALPAGTLGIALNGVPISATVQPDGSLLSESLMLQSGEGKLSATLEHEGEIAASAWRSIAVTQGEDVLVLSQNKRLVDTFHALLPRFAVHGVASGELETALTAVHARAIVLPCEEAAGMSAAGVAALRHFVEDGGAVLATGMSEKTRRDAVLDDAIAELLPVTFDPVEPLPPDNVTPDIKRESGKEDVARVSVVFVIDHSGSMNLNYRWNHTRQAVNLALEHIKEYDRVGVILFTDHATWVDATPVKGSGITAVLPAKRSGIKGWLENNPPQDALTDIYGAVETGLNALVQDRARIRLMVVISDGEESHARNPSVDHPELRRKAIDNGISIAAIRVGAQTSAFDGRAATVMNTLSTGDDMTFSVSDTDAKAVIPQLVVSRVSYAYQKAREQEEKRDDVPKPPDGLPPPSTDVEFIPGTQDMLITAQGTALLGEQKLPKLGGGLARTTPRNDAIALASLASEPATTGLAVQRMGLGNVVYMAAPLDATHAGSWLQSEDAASFTLDLLIRLTGRQRLAELAPLLSLHVESGVVMARPAGIKEDLKCFAVTGDNKEYELALEAVGGVFVAHIPSGIAWVDIRDGAGRALARCSTVDTELARLQLPPTVTRVSTLRHDVDSPRAQAPVPSILMIALLASLALAVMPVERYLRRV